MDIEVFGWQVGDEFSEMTVRRRYTYLDIVMDLVRRIMQ
jgi:hypothetical protein